MEVARDFPRVPVNRFPGVHSFAHRRQLIWALLDQIFRSLANLGLSIVAGRALGARGLGAVFFGFVVYSLGIQLQRLLLTEPLVARTAVGSQEGVAARTAAAFTASLVYGLIASALAVAIALTIDTPTTRGLLSFVPWIVLLHAQDFVRGVLYRDAQARSACISDALWVAVMGAATAWSISHPSLASVVGAWGAGGLIALFAAISFAGVRPAAPTDAWHWWLNEGWLAGRQIFAGAAVDNLLGQATLASLAFILGASHVGGLRAAQSVFGPMSLLGPAIELPGLPIVARAAAVSDAAARRVARNLIGVLLAALALYEGAMAVNPAGILGIVYGPEFRTFGFLVWPIAIHQVAWTLLIGTFMVMKAQRRTSQIMHASFVGAAAKCALTLIGASLWGLVGAAWGLTIGTVIHATAAVAFQPRRERVRWRRG